MRKNVIQLIMLLMVSLLQAQEPANGDGALNNSKVAAKISGSTEETPCNLDPLVETYICGDSANPLLIKNTFMGFLSLSLDHKTGMPKIKIVESLTSDGKILFAAKTFPKSEVVTNLSTIKADYNEKISSVENFFGNGMGHFAKIKKGSDLYETVAAEIISSKDQLKQSFDPIIKAKNYSVELSDGQKINCVRSATRAFSKEEQEFAKQMDLTYQCGAFKCNPVIVNGKSYEATLIYDSSPNSFSPTSFHLMDQSGIGPKVALKTITTNDYNIPMASEEELKDRYTGYASMIEKLYPERLGDDRSLIAAYKNPLLQESLNYNQNLCSDSEALTQLIEAKKKLLIKLAELEMAEFIQVLADGRLIGQYIDPSKASEYGCLHNGLYLDKNAEKNLQLLKKNIYPDRKVEQTITPARASELFNKAAAMKDIAWKYTPDGCYARAHLMARRFEAEGVRVDKVWIKGDLAVPEAGVRWNFHVAPILYVENEKGQIQKMVIDPSLFDKPVTVEEWDNKMKKGTAKGSVITAFPFPENAAVFERSALSFSSSDPYLPRDSIYLSEADKMLMADSTMQMYKAVEPK